MEPQWTKQIPSSLICDTYYAFFIVYAVIFVIAFLNAGYTAFFLKGVNPVLKIVLLLANGVVSAVVITLMLFMYLMCDRALIGPQMKDKTDQFQTY